MALDRVVQGQFVRVLGKDQTFVVVQIEGLLALVAPVDEVWWKFVEGEAKPGRFSMQNQRRFVVLHRAKIEMRTGRDVYGAVLAVVLYNEATWHGLEDLEPHEGAWKWSQRLRC